MIRTIPLIALILLFCHCSQAGEPRGSDGTASTVAGKTFFDLEGYMDSEVARLNGGATTVSKTVSIGGKTERKELRDSDFTNDLAIFRKAAINKPAWSDKYRIEAAGNDTSYIATDSTMRTRHLQVLRNASGQIERIEIKRRSGNVLSNGSQELTYRPATGYRIYSKQIGDLVGDAEVSVVVEF